MFPGPGFADPNAMRAVARVLATKADGLSGVGGRVAGTSQIDFEGPAANRHRHAVAQWRQTTEQVAGELRAAAQALMQEATLVEQEIVRVENERRAQELRRQAGGLL